MQIVKLKDSLLATRSDYIILGDRNEEVTFTRAVSPDNVKEYTKKLKDLTGVEIDLILGTYVQGIAKESLYYPKASLTGSKEHHNPK